MNFLSRIYCRIYQQIFHLAIPFLPYRNPKIIKLNELNTILNKENVNKLMIVTDKNLVAKFREEIKNNIVPIASKLFKEQAKRININDPKMYDYSLSYLDGNPMPKGNKDELIDKALKMYSQMSKETKEFFTLMIDNELMDLETKPGKMSGGYMTHFAKYKVPFIFSNFNGTSDDVNVLTHEAGHAFMYYYASKFIDNESLIFPTMETCEIHSTAMEFFAYPYLYLYTLVESLKDLPLILLRNLYKLLI